MFADARPDDGRLELGVVNADGVADWMRTWLDSRRSARTLAARAGDVGKKIKVKLNRKVLYEMDGGAREKIKSFGIEVEPAASPSAYRVRSGDQ